MPVDEVPDYLDVIKQPMDFAAIGSKIAEHRYLNIQEFQVSHHLFDVLVCSDSPIPIS